MVRTGSSGKIHIDECAEGADAVTSVLGSLASGTLFRCRIFPFLNIPANLLGLPACICQAQTISHMEPSALPFIKNHQLSWWFDGEPLKAVSKDSATFGMGLWDH